MHKFHILWRTETSDGSWRWQHIFFLLIRGVAGGWSWGARDPPPPLPL